MLCPHCNQNLLYKERNGKKCSKCGRAFAFEPKTDALGLHDKRFRKATAKLGAEGKLYFTSGQLQHFLSRKKIKNSFNTVRRLWFFFMFVALAVAILLLIAGSSVIFLLAAVLIFTFFAALLFASRKKEGELSLPQSRQTFESSVLGRWREVYQQLPATFLTSHKLPPQNLENVHGALVCAEPEILACLSANGTHENLGLLLLDANQPEKTNLEFVQKRSDLPIFVLHDASAEGFSLKAEFISAHLAANRNRKVYDIGLRPKTVLKAKLLHLRKKVPEAANKALSGLTPEENAWLGKGNYTPLLALGPARLVKLVTRGVNQRFQAAAKTNLKAAEKNDHKAAQGVGFMTWFGE